MYESRPTYTSEDNGETNLDSDIDMYEKPSVNVSTVENQKEASTSSTSGSHV